MTTFTGTVLGREYTIHAPEPGQFDSADFFGRFLPSAQGWLGHDTEFTYGGMFDAGARLRLAQFGTATEAYVLDLSDPAQRAGYGSVIRRPIWLVSHNGAAEAESAYVDQGVDITAHGRLYDTLTVALLSDPGEQNDHGLKALSEQLIDDQLVKADDELKAVFRELYGSAHGRWKTAKRKGETVQVLDEEGQPIWLPARGTMEAVESYGWDNIPTRHPAYLRYAGLDAIYVRLLAPRLAARAKQLGVAERIPTELRINDVGIRMRLRGWRIDQAEVARQLATTGAENEAALAEYEARYGHSARSPKRVDLLADMGVQFKAFTDKGTPSLKKDALDELIVEYPDNEVLQLLYRQASTANVSLFLGMLSKGIDSEGYVHPPVRTLGAVTGRWTVGNGIQTASTKSGTRNVFRPRERRVLVSSDLPQIEARVVAAEAGAEHFIEQMRQGIDAYAAATLLVFGQGWDASQRKKIKRIILGTIYASGVATLVKQAKYQDGWLDATPEAITEARRQFLEAVPEIAALSKRMQRESCVWLTSGRFVPVDPTRVYKNINSVGQGNARDYLMDCMLRAVDAGLDNYLLMAMHDELILDAPLEDLQEIVETLRTCMSVGYKGVPTPPDTEIFPDHWAGAGIPWAKWLDGVRELPGSG